MSEKEKPPKRGFFCLLKHAIQPMYIFGASADDEAVPDLQNGIPMGDNRLIAAKDADDQRVSKEGKITHARQMVSLVK